MFHTTSLHYDCSYNKNTKRYGLYNATDNFFCILDTNFQRLKFVQLLLIKYQRLPIAQIDLFFNILDDIKKIAKTHSAHLSPLAHSVYLKKYNLKSSNNKYQKEINNNNCFLFGLENPIIINESYVDIDILADRQSNTIIKHKQIPNVNKEIREKIFLLQYILYHIDSSVEFHTVLARQQKNFYQQATIEYGNFFKLCYPTDSKIEQIIKDELEFYNSIDSEIFNYRSTIMQLLNKLDYSESTKQIILNLLALLEDEFYPTYDAQPNSYRSIELSLFINSFKRKINELRIAYDNQFK